MWFAILHVFSIASLCGFLVVGADLLSFEPISDDLIIIDTAFKNNERHLDILKTDTEQCLNAPTTVDSGYAFCPFDANALGSPCTPSSACFLSYAAVYNIDDVDCQGPTENGSFGTCCDSNSQCESGLCDANTRTCTTQCRFDYHCPVAPESHLRPKCIFDDSTSETGTCEARSQVNVDGEGKCTRCLGSGMSQACLRDISTYCTNSGDLDATCSSSWVSALMENLDTESVGLSDQSQSSSTSGTNDIEQELIAQCDAFICNFNGICDAGESILHCPHDCGALDVCIFDDPTICAACAPGSLNATSSTSNSSISATNILSVEECLSPTEGDGERNLGECCDTDSHCASGVCDSISRTCTTTCLTNTDCTLESSLPICSYHTLRQYMGVCAAVEMNVNISHISTQPSHDELQYLSPCSKCLGAPPTQNQCANAVTEYCMSPNGPGFLENDPGCSTDFSQSIIDSTEVDKPIWLPVLQLPRFNASWIDSTTASVSLRHDIPDARILYQVVQVSPKHIVTPFTIYNEKIILINIDKTQYIVFAYARHPDYTNSMIAQVQYPDALLSETPSSSLPLQISIGLASLPPVIVPKGFTVEFPVRVKHNFGTESDTTVGLTFIESTLSIQSADSSSISEADISVNGNGGAVFNVQLRPSMSATTSSSVLLQMMAEVTLELPMNRTFWLPAGSAVLERYTNSEAKLVRFVTEFQTMFVDIGSTHADRKVRQRALNEIKDNNFVGVFKHGNYRNLLSQQSDDTSYHITPITSSSCHIWGATHVRTFSGLVYHMQDAGTFVLAYNSYNHILIEGHSTSLSPYYNVSAMTSVSISSPSLYSQSKTLSGSSIMPSIVITSSGKLVADGATFDLLDDILRDQCTTQVFVPGAMINVTKQHDTLQVIVTLSETSERITIDVLQELVNVHIETVFSPVNDWLSTQSNAALDTDISPIESNLHVAWNGLCGSFTREMLQSTYASNSSNTSSTAFTIVEDITFERSDGSHVSANEILSESTALSSSLINFVRSWDRNELSGYQLQSTFNVDWMKLANLVANSSVTLNETSQSLPSLATISSAIHKNCTAANTMIPRVLPIPGRLLMVYSDEEHLETLVPDDAQIEAMWTATTELLAYENPTTAMRQRLYSYQLPTLDLVNKIQNLQNTPDSQLRAIVIQCMYGPFKYNKVLLTSCIADAMYVNATDKPNMNLGMRIYQHLSMQLRSSVLRSNVDLILMNTPRNLIVAYDVLSEVKIPSFVQTVRAIRVQSDNEGLTFTPETSTSGMLRSTIDVRTNTDTSWLFTTNNALTSRTNMDNDHMLVIRQNCTTTIQTVTRQDQNNNTLIVLELSSGKNDLGLKTSMTVATIIEVFAYSLLDVESITNSLNTVSMITAPNSTQSFMTGTSFETAWTWNTDHATDLTTSNTACVTYLTVPVENVANDNSVIGVSTGVTPAVASIEYVLALNSSKLFEGSDATTLQSMYSMIDQFRYPMDHQTIDLNTMVPPADDYVVQIHPFASSSVISNDMIVVSEHFTITPHSEWYKTPWSNCSANCSTGIQTRTVLCRNSGTKEVIDTSVCEQILHDKPSTYQFCFERECSLEEMNGKEFQIVAAPWQSCTTNCTTGVSQRTREVGCFARNGTRYTESQYDQYTTCLNAALPNSVIPSSEQCTDAINTCNMVPPPGRYQWRKGDWSNCQPQTCSADTLHGVSSGNNESMLGIHSRTLTCIDSMTNIPASPSKCDTRPSRSEVCELTQSGNVCSNLKYQVSKWGLCSSTCTNGIQTRTVKCVDATQPSREYELRACEHLLGPIPSTEQLCGGSCKPTVAWSASDWGSCMGNCSSNSVGYKQRTLQCMNQTSSEIIPLSVCEEFLSQQSRPSVNQSCVPNNCDACDLLGCEHGTCTYDNIGMSATTASSSQLNAQCTCAAGWTGVRCDIPIADECTPVDVNIPTVYDASGECCSSGVLDSTGSCCMPSSLNQTSTASRRSLGTSTSSSAGTWTTTTSWLDREGVCCVGGSSQVDACGICGGNGVGIDRFGKCCHAPATLAADMRCCMSGRVDDCGICDGDGSSCKASTTIIVQIDTTAPINDILDATSPINSIWISQISKSISDILQINSSLVKIQNITQDAELSTRPPQHVAVNIVVLPRTSETSTFGSEISPSQIEETLQAFDGKLPGISNVELVNSNPSDTPNVVPIPVCGNSLCEIEELCLSPFAYGNACCENDCFNHIPTRSCPATMIDDVSQPCSGHGDCNIDTGICQCDFGFTGDACDTCDTLLGFMKLGNPNGFICTQLSVGRELAGDTPQTDDTTPNNDDDSTDDDTQKPLNPSNSNAASDILLPAVLGGVGAALCGTGMLLFVMGRRHKRKRKQERLTHRSTKHGKALTANPVNMTNPLRNPAHVQPEASESKTLQSLNANVTPIDSQNMENPMRQVNQMNEQSRGAMSKTQFSPLNATTLSAQQRNALLHGRKNPQQRPLMKRARSMSRNKKEFDQVIASYDKHGGNSNVFSTGAGVSKSNNARDGHAGTALWMNPETEDNEEMTKTSIQTQNKMSLRQLREDMSQKTPRSRRMQRPR